MENNNCDGFLCVHCDSCDFRDDCNSMCDCYCSCVDCIFDYDFESENCYMNF